MYVPYRSNDEVTYGWIFDNGSLDVSLWLLEFAIIGLVAFVVRALDGALG
jgi:hypothetical protein